MLDSVERRFQDGDYMGALTLLNKRNSLYEPTVDAAALAADIYESMELWKPAAEAWFRFLDTCNEADFSEGYEGLAICFMNMGEELQSAMYFRHVYGEDEDGENEIELPSRPKLRLVHDVDGDPEVLERGLLLLKAGALEEARTVLTEVPLTNPDYPSATGLAAMCTLMLGEEKKAEAECEALLEKYPDNVQALTTYCAVLGANENKEGAKAVARRLAGIESQTTEDLFRIATALCETGLDEEALEKLTKLRKKIPYDDTVLYFTAVAAHHLGRTDEAIEALERLTTLYPRKAVAEYYLVRLRELKDGGQPFSMNYYYRIPEEEYNLIADFFLRVSNAPDRDAEQFSKLPELLNFCKIAFDEMDGRDEKLQMLAVKVALKTHLDGFLREVLLDPSADEIVKLAILHGLTVRNEDDSFGTVICNIYREFFTHSIDVGKHSGEFLKAFADVYSKFALITSENEQQIVAAAEDIYHTLEEAGATSLLSERHALAAAIYRESRLHHSEHSFEDLLKLFDADRLTVEEILNYMI